MTKPKDRTPVKKSTAARTSLARVNKRHPPKKDRHGRRITKRPDRDPEFRSFFEEVPREGFMEALSTRIDDVDPRYYALYASIMAPANANVTLQTLCRRHGLTLVDMTDLWRDHNIRKGTFRAISHLPTVMEDTAIDAKAVMTPCGRCEGTGEVSTTSGDEVITRSCGMCRGKGEIRVPGDKDCRATMFEMAGLTGKRGPLVAFQQNISGLASESLESVVNATQKLISGKKKVKNG